MSNKQKHEKMKNYIVTIFYKTRQNENEKEFTCVVKGKKGYAQKAFNILCDYKKGSGFSCFITDQCCEEQTKLEPGTIIAIS